MKALAFLWRCFGHSPSIHLPQNSLWTPWPIPPIWPRAPPEELTTLPHLTGTHGHHQSPFKVAYHPITPSRWPQPAAEPFLNNPVPGVQPTTLKHLHQLQPDLIASPTGSLSCPPVCFGSHSQACTQLYQLLTPHPSGPIRVTARSLR